MTVRTVAAATAMMMIAAACTNTAVVEDPTETLEGSTRTTSAVSTTTVPTPEVVGSSTVPATTVSALSSFGDGVWVVGRDIEPGTYRNSGTSEFCLWERLSGFGGRFEDILAAEVSGVTQTVTIKASDTGFSSTDCGTWSGVTVAGSTPVSSFGDGVWVVGDDIEPGTYQNSDSSEFCLWERLGGFSGDVDDILAISLSGGIQRVTIRAGDAGFSSTDCGTWTKTG